MMKKNISDSTASRLPMYYRCLRELLVKGYLRVSSKEIGERLGLTSSQVRADLSSFGKLGQQGYGYAVKLLYVEVSKILGVGDNMQAIILASAEKGVKSFYPLFEGRGITLRAVFFDILEGEEETSGEYPFVFSSASLEGYLRENPTDLALVMPEKSDIPGTADILSAGGVRGVWNLSNTDMHSKTMVVKNMPVGDVLMSLCYDIKKKN